MHKRLIAMMLAVVLSICMSMSAFAQETQVGYMVTSNYEIVIPAYIDLNMENQLEISASFLSLMDGYHVDVTIAPESLNNGTLILTSSEGNTIGTEMQVVSDGSGVFLADDLRVASFDKNGLEYGGKLQIMPLADQYTYAGQYYATLVFETELVQR